MINTPSIPTIYSIYCITNIINGKRYIGFTSKNPPEKRWKEHCRNNNAFISQSIKEYGIDNFTFEIILQGWDIDHILSMETYFIKEYNTLNPHGYNLTSGGQYCEFSTETKQKMSKARTGRKHSEETKQKMSLSSKGERNAMYGKRGPLSSSYGKRGNLSPNYGRKHSEETKLKMSLSRKGKRNPMYGIAFGAKQYTIKMPSGLIESITNLSEFCKNLSIGRKYLYQYSKQNKPFKGYQIIYPE